MAFVLAGIRAPRVGRTPNERSEPFGPEALSFVAEKCLQRDVEIQIENTDKTGAFIGSLFIGGENLAVLLLREGLANIHEYSANESQYTNQLYDGERAGRAAKKNLWKDYDEEKEQAAAAAAAAQATKDDNVVVEEKKQYIDLVVSEYTSGHQFYIQVVNADIKKLETLMTELSQYHTSRGGMDGPHKPRVGDIVSAKFTEDDSWYRAKVRRVAGDSVDVLYIDYGNVSFLFFFFGLCNYYNHYYYLV